MSAPAASHIIRQVASALSATHAKGIVHRDLKPANVFLLSVEGETDFVKVVDFGISKVRAAGTKLTAALAVMGTPNYMAPEQAEGRIDEIDHRTDQWALACIAYELVGGRPPFVGENVASLLYQVIHQAPSPLASMNPGLPSQVEDVLRRALSKTQIGRFSTMTEFSRAFEGAASGRRRLSRRRRPRRRRGNRARADDGVQPGHSTGDDVLERGRRVDRARPDDVRAAEAALAARGRRCRRRGGSGRRWICVSVARFGRVGAGGRDGRDDIAGGRQQRRRRRVVTRAAAAAVAAPARRQRATAGPRRPPSRRRRRRRTASTKRSRRSSRASVAAATRTGRGRHGAARGRRRASPRTAAAATTGRRRRRAPPRPRPRGRRPRGRRPTPRRRSRRRTEYHQENVQVASTPGGT